MRRYSIKETAELSGLAESTLRYYETMDLAIPKGRDDVASSTSIDIST